MIDLKGEDQSWWPDLANETVAILAGGPSITREQCDAVRALGWWAVTINESYQLARWAPARYGCDWQWWRAKAPRGESYGGMCIVGTLPSANGKKPHLPPDMRWLAKSLRYLPVKAGFRRGIWHGREVGAGQNSAFQAANWVARCGARRIALLGVDCHSPNKHWHGNHCFPEAPNQKPSLMQTWIDAWQNIAREFAERGIDCVNCSPGTECDAFPRLTLEEAARRFGADGISEGAAPSALQRRGDGVSIDKDRLQDRERAGRGRRKRARAVEPLSP